MDSGGELEGPRVSITTQSLVPVRAKVDWLREQAYDAEVKLLRVHTEGLKIRQHSVRLRCWEELVFG